MSAPEGFDQLSEAEQLEWAARKAARTAGVDPDLVSAIGYRESGFNADAKGKLGEIGAFQIMPATGQALGYTPEQLADPVTNIEAATKHLATLSQKYNGDPHAIAAAYNGGEGAVDKGRVPPAAKAYANAITAEIARRQGRSAEKAVDIPGTAALVEREQQREVSQLPLADQLGAGIIDPPTELAMSAARALGGSSIPRPTTSRLLGDAAAVGSLVAPGFKVGRLASAAIQAGAGAVQAFTTAATEHARGDASWQEQLRAMSDGDLLSIGASTLASGTLGALLPGEKPTSLTQAGGLSRASRLGPLAPRGAAAQAGPAPMRAAVQEAFGRIDKTAAVDATGWRDAVLAHAADGKAVPSEVRAVLDRLQPVTAMVPVQEPVTVPSALGGMLNVVGIDGKPAMQTVMRSQPTGRWRGNVGDLLQVNQALGNMVNTTNARDAAAAAGHSVGNLTALKGSLSDALETALPRPERALYQQARQTALDSAQNARALARLERYANPDQGFLNGRGLYRDLVQNAGQRVRAMGQDNYDALLGFAKSVRTIGADPKRMAALASIMHTGGAGFLGYLAERAVPGAGLPVTGALLGGRVLYSMATSPTARAALDQLANAPIGSKAFTIAAGKLGMAYALAGTEEAKRAPTPQAPAMGPPPTPATRMPPPL